jgi:hypothetical protein
MGKEETKKTKKKKKEKQENKIYTNSTQYPCGKFNLLV